MLKTPDVYGLKLVASTITETTAFDSQEDKSSQLVILTYRETLKSPPSTLHSPGIALYG